MPTWFKNAIDGLTATESEIVEDYYRSTFDATAPQLRAILAELDRETAIPAVAVEALKKITRISLSDAAYIAY